MMIKVPNMSKVPIVMTLVSGMPARKGTITEERVIVGADFGVHDEKGMVVENSLDEGVVDVEPLSFRPYGAHNVKMGQYLNFFFMTHTCLPKWHASYQTLTSGRVEVAKSLYVTVRPSYFIFVIRES